MQDLSHIPEFTSSPFLGEIEKVLSHRQLEPKSYNRLIRIANRGDKNDAKNAISGLALLAAKDIAFPKKQDFGSLVRQALKNHIDSEHYESVACHALLTLYNYDVLNNTFSLDALSGLRNESLDISDLTQQALSFFDDDAQKAMDFIVFVQKNGYISEQDVLEAYDLVSQTAQEPIIIHHEFFFGDNTTLSTDNVCLLLDKFRSSNQNIIPLTLEPLFKAARSRIEGNAAQKMLSSAETMTLASWIGSIDHKAAFQALDHLEAAFGDVHDLQIMSLLQRPFDIQENFSPETQREAVKVLRNVCSRRLEDQAAKIFTAKFKLLDKLVNAYENLNDPQDDITNAQFSEAAESLTDDLFKTTSMYPFLRSILTGERGSQACKTDAYTHGSPEWVDHQISYLCDVFGRLDSSGILGRPDDARSLTDLFGSILGSVRQIVDIEGRMASDLNGELRLFPKT